MKRYLTTFLIGAAFAVLLFAPILAQAGECGVGGTAKNVAGVEITKTDQEAKDQGARIGEDGYWCGTPSARRFELLGLRPVVPHRAGRVHSLFQRAGALVA